MARDRKLLFSMPGFTGNSEPVNIWYIKDLFAFLNCMQESRIALRYYLKNRELFRGKGRGQGFAAMIWINESGALSSTGCSLIPADNKDDGLSHPTIEIERNGENSVIEVARLTSDEISRVLTSQKQHILDEHLGSSMICVDGKYFVFRVASQEPRGGGTGVIHIAARKILYSIYKNPCLSHSMAEKKENGVTIGQIIAGGIILRDPEDGQGFHSIMLTSAVFNGKAIQYPPEMMLMARWCEVPVDANGKLADIYALENASLYKCKYFTGPVGADIMKLDMWWILRTCPPEMCEEFTRMLCNLYREEYHNAFPLEDMKDPKFSNAAMKPEPDSVAPTKNIGRHIRAFYPVATPEEKNALLAFQMLLSLTYSSVEFPDTLDTRGVHDKRYNPIAETLYYICLNANIIAHRQNKTTTAAVMRELLDIKYAPLNGDTVLIAAVRSKNIKAIELLLNHGASLSIQNNLGEDALRVADPEIKKVLAELHKQQEQAAAELKAAERRAAEQVAHAILSDAVIHAVKSAERNASARKAQALANAARVEQERREKEIQLRTFAADDYSIGIRTVINLFFAPQATEPFDQSIVTGADAKKISKK